MKNIPKEIYLNLGIPKRVFDITRDDIDFKQLNGVGWSTDKIDDQDLKFVLSDVSQQRELLVAVFEKMTQPQITMLEIGDYQELADELLSN